LNGKPHGSGFQNWNSKDVTWSDGHADDLDPSQDERCLDHSSRETLNDISQDLGDSLNNATHQFTTPTTLDQCVELRTHAAYFCDQNSGYGVEKSTLSHPDLGARLASSKSSQVMMHAGDSLSHDDSLRNEITDGECKCLVCLGIGTKEVSLDDHNRYCCRVLGCSWSTSKLYDHQSAPTLIASREHEKEHFNLRAFDCTYNCRLKECQFITKDVAELWHHRKARHQYPGPPPHKVFTCKMKDCTFSMEQDSQILSHYLAEHRLPVKSTETRYICRERRCQFTSKRWSDLLRHCSAKHCTRSKKFSCPILWCKYNGNTHGFSRKDKLQSHMRNVHEGKVASKKARGQALPKIQPKK